mmetsp:Transcript_24092/g.67044  ORF Transcript_24092/g.67044 Transcript_24092/m.67044 type:complete len:257 (+) Transcript_24092:504-1274(+)
MAKVVFITLTFRISLATRRCSKRAHSSFFALRFSTTRLHQDGQHNDKIKRLSLRPQRENVARLRSQTLVRCRFSDLAFAATPSQACKPAARIARLLHPKRPWITRAILSSSNLRAFFNSSWNCAANLRSSRRQRHAIQISCCMSCVLPPTQCFTTLFTVSLCLSARRPTAPACLRNWAISSSLLETWTVRSFSSCFISENAFPSSIGRSPEACCKALAVARKAFRRCNTSALASLSSTSSIASRREAARKPPSLSA